jgi:Kef-type K+ transport system membrane component KefB
VALVEIVVGALVGDIPGSAVLVQQTKFTTFLATWASAVLTFLAGAEIDPDSLRRHWRASIGIGLVSFAPPFAGALLFSRYVLDWSWSAAEIYGVALSTTSVAVVYAVMVETGLNRVDLGKLILAACFVTGLTFGSIAALYGLTSHLIDQVQYSELVTVVILSAFVPTLIAEQFFQPEFPDEEIEDTAGEEDLTAIHLHRRPVGSTSVGRLKDAADQRE